MDTLGTRERFEVRATRDGSCTVWDGAVDQTMHSGAGAVTEATHVYLEASGVKARLQQGRATTVVEVGLGTGLNFLLTADVAHEAKARLTYRAIERTIVAPEILAALCWERWLTHPDLHAAWSSIASTLATMPESPDVTTTFHLSPWVSLEVAWGDAFAPRDAADVGRLSPAAMVLLAPSSVHAVYHDAYSPDAHPEAWTQEVLSTCVDALVPGGRWVTYSVAGAVRRALQAAGATVDKRPGPPGGKREILVASKALTSKEGASDPTASPTR